MSNQRVFVELKQKKKTKKVEPPRQIGNPAVARILTAVGEVFLGIAENMKKEKKKKKNKEAGRAAQQPDELTQDQGPEPILPSPEVIGDPVTEAIKELIHKDESKD